MRFVEKGGFSRAWMIMRGRDFEPLRGEPAFEAMVEKVGNMARREREALTSGEGEPDPEALLALHRAAGTQST